MLLEEKLEINGIYDPGSQISIINPKFIKIKEEKKDLNKVTLKTINGVTETKGLVSIKIKIFEIEKKIDVYIMDSNNNIDFLIGLDMIQIFKLSQDEQLKISQNKKIDKDRTQIETENNMIKAKVNFNEHVKKEDLKIDLKHLDNKQKSKVEELIEKYKTIFAKDKYDIGYVSDYEARIELLVDKFCSKRPYRCTIDDKKEIEQQVAKLLENNLIEESYSPFAAPVTLAFKRDEEKKSRLCIDFRDLNKIVIPQAQPFPLIDDLILKARNCKYFTSLDINSAFWSIPLRIEDRSKTGFITQEGHYQWTCLPFGLKTAPAIFQRILSSILRKNNLKNFTENYIDDILIFSETFEEHLIHIEQVLRAIIKEGFRLKFKKCTFASESIKYLGHIIENNTVRPIKDNLISIQNFPTPKTQKNIRQFLGKINFYHEYIPKISIKLDPLHRLLRKDVKFNWTEDCEKSFMEIKKLLCAQPVLEIFDRNLPIRIYTDASLEGMGAILKQIQKNGKEKPVAYFSKKLNEIQKRKKAIYLECLAIKEAVKYWEHWLIGRKFEVYSDHKPLENLNIKVRTDEELGDLTYYLSQFEFNIKYIPGKLNTEADCLSRNPVLEPLDTTQEVLKIVNMVKIEEIKKDQNENNALKNLKRKSIDKHGIIYIQRRNKKKIVLSEKLSIKLIKDMHIDWCHIGIRQMINRIYPHYTSQKLLDNIQRICKTCNICKRNKSRGQTKYGLMSHLGPATKPFEIVSIDTIGGFGGQRSTKRYLHLLVDHFTRYAWILTSKNQSANDFVKLVETTMEVEKIEIIMTDQYPGINSKEFKNYLKNQDIKLIFTALNAPFSNGLNERLNQTIINKIRCRINGNIEKKAWTTIAKECVDRYNETEHSTTSFTPKYLLDGTNTSPLPDELKEDKTAEDWKTDRNFALQKTIKSHEYNKRLFDKNRKEHEFNEGDLVYVENGNKLNRKKLDELRIGPFEIIEKISNSIYRIRTGKKNQETALFHITKLIPIEQ